MRSSDQSGDISTQTSLSSAPKPLIKLTLKLVNNPDLAVDNVSPDESIGNLKVLIESKHGIIHSLQRLIYNGTELDDNDTLSRLGIHDGKSTLHMVVRKVPPSSNNPAASGVIPMTTDSFYPVNDSAERFPALDGTIATRVAEVRLHVGNLSEHGPARPAAGPNIQPESTRFVSVERIKLLRRSVMLMASVSIITSFSFALIVTPWWLILALLGLMGFQGARTLRRESILLFMMVEMSMLIIFFMVLYAVFENADVTTGPIVVLVILIGIRAYTIAQCWSLYIILGGVNPDHVLRVLVLQ